MDTLILEDVRCFHERHELPLAPLTILVGENSTGKSTILAATRLAWDISNGNLAPDFAEEPFD
ncbi:MAG: AAA family ATPase, partial [Thermoguttaceae bacterium]